MTADPNLLRRATFAPDAKAAREGLEVWIAGAIGAGPRVHPARLGHAERTAAEAVASVLQLLDDQRERLALTERRLAETQLLAVALAEAVRKLAQLGLDNRATLRELWPSPGEKVS